MTGLSIDSGLRHHRFRRVRSPWVWLVVAAASAYLVLVVVMILNAGASTTAFRALAGAPTAAREVMPVEPAVPAARRPSTGSTRPSRPVTPLPGAGAVYYTPDDLTTTPAATPVTAPTTAPVTIPTEVGTARQTVDRARQALLALRASGTATAAEIEVAAYELARARQNLADLEAGTPGKQHHDLDVLQAQVYRNLAVERCRAAMLNPAVSASDQERAYALVRLWQKRLDDLTA